MAAAVASAGSLIAYALIEVRDLKTLKDEKD
jgi:hypothetical protein